MIGPKKVEWTPIANSAASISGMATVCTAMPFQAIANPAAPTSMIPTSAALTMRMIRALSRISASWPESAESVTNGSTNSAEAMPLNAAS